MAGSTQPFFPEKLSSSLLLDRPGKKEVLNSFRASGTVCLPKRDVGVRIVSNNLTRPTDISMTKYLDLKNIRKINDFAVR